MSASEETRISIDNSGLSDSELRGVCDIPTCLMTYEADSRRLQICASSTEAETDVEAEAEAGIFAFRALVAPRDTSDKLAISAER
jgi:hypothetical protein